MTKMTKTIKLECRTWSLLKERKIQKPNGDWETFAETVARLLKEHQRLNKRR